MRADRNELQVLFIDLEIAYALYYAHPSKRPQYNPARNIKHYPFCLCASYKWLHETVLQNVSVLDDPEMFDKDFRNSCVVAKSLHEEMSRADIIIAHNCDGFDMKECNNLFILYDLGPIPVTKTIDTLKIARRYFRFAGNSLSDLATLFKLPAKLEKPDWVLLTEGNREEIEKAIVYCDRGYRGVRGGL